MRGGVAEEVSDSAHHLWHLVGHQRLCREFEKLVRDVCPRIHGLGSSTSRYHLGRPRAIRVNI
jgi:hypothetical protein